MKKVIIALAVLLVLSACSSQATTSSLNPSMDLPEANTEPSESSKLPPESTSEPTPDLVAEQEFDYTLFINSNMPNLIMIFGDDYEAGAYSLIYPFRETTGQIEFTTDYLIEHALEQGRDLSTAIEMSITEVTIICNERIKITSTELFTNMSSEEVISWCSENNYEFSDQQNLHSGTEFLNIDYGELEILYLWIDDIFDSVTITKKSDGTSENWDDSDSQWPNEPAGENPAANLPTVTYYMFGKSVGEYMLGSDGLYHRNILSFCWGWYNNKPVYSSSGFISRWDSSTDCAAKAGQGGFFLPETVDPNAGYIQCPKSVVNYAWESSYSN